MNAKGLCISVVAFAVAQGSLANYVDSLQPGFSFEYVQSGESDLHIPVTSQCERVVLEWKRDKNSTGPSPVAPYFLQVFNSESETPYIIPAGLGPTFDWEVPFPPSTVYQICMSDVNGVSGGCEQMHSVVNSTTNSSCQNVTTQTPMWVSATVPTGALPKHGYIDQCKELTVQANNAAGPFTMTITPSGHPPYNITSGSKSITWRVSLPQGSRFFVSLYSSDGQSWSNGPIRVGGLGTDDCLTSSSVRRSDFTVYIIGSTIGATCFGLLAGIAAYYFFMRLRRPRRMAPSQKYYKHPYLSQDEDPFKTHRTPAGSLIGTTTSSIGRSMIGQTANVTQSPRSTTESREPMTPLSRSSELPLLAHSSLEPLRPLRSSYGQPSTLSRQSTLSRLASSVTPFTVAPSETSSTHSYPLDIKRPIPHDDDETTTPDDMTATTSTSYLQRAPSARSRAPTYVADPPPNSIPPPMPSLSRGIRSSHRMQPSIEEHPPLYGNHVADHSLNYDPNVLSSGTRL